MLALLLALQTPVARVDWPVFLARHDLVWDRLPTRWGESAFIGNGRLGATIDAQGGVLGWTINRTDVVHDQSRWVRIHSLAGQPCRLVVPDWDTAVVRAHEGPAPRVTRDSAGAFVIDLRRAASVVLAPEVASPLPDARPVALPPGRNPFPILKDGDLRDPQHTHLTLDTNTTVGSRGYRPKRRP
jgi:hypothetical protein